MLANSALIVIDLQQGIVSRPHAPYTGEQVVTNAQKLVDACREHHIPVILVHVKPSPQTALHPDADVTNPHTQQSPDFADLVLKQSFEDIIITKHQWGAFYGTDLELQLRRRKITTLLICGISTNIGVESTARFAYEFGFSQVFIEDAMTAASKEEHESAIKIFKRMGHVRSTGELLKQIAK